MAMKDRSRLPSGMSETVVVNFERPIPVFPLPGAVLLPQGVLPLHIFEPRYLRMVGDALDSHGLIAMGLFEGEVSDREYIHGRPPLRPRVCVGYCQEYEPMEDGRYMLLLHGLCRARILEEVDQEAYRAMMLEPTELPPADDEQLEPYRQRIERALHDPELDAIEPVQRLRLLPEQPISTAALIDVLLFQLCRETGRRYEMLCEDDAARRGRWLTRNLRELCEQIDSPDEPFE